MNMSENYVFDYCCYFCLGAKIIRTSPERLSNSPYGVFTRSSIHPASWKFYGN